jgi:uncharacterized membrane protein YjjP (DUF1212 family)
VAHLALVLGRLLMFNGADTGQVHDSVARFARRFGAEANLVVSYEALVVTVSAGDRFRTKIGHRVPGMNVGVSALYALDRLLTDVEAGRATLEDARARLDDVEHRFPANPPWAVTLGMALTAASLSRLFGGDWGTFFVVAVVGAVQTRARLEMVRRQANPVLVTFASALLGGVVGGIGVRLGASGAPPLCLVCPGMILVPGVPLINGVRDLMGNHVTLGVSRLAFASAVVMAIALGLYGAMLLTGVNVPVGAPAVVIGVAQDAVFSVLAAAGFTVLFNVPARIAWACLACGIAGHALRALLFHLGIDLITGTLLSALAVGALGQCFARLYTAPMVAFAFAGVVAMIPGVYAFRAVIGCMQIAHGAPGATLLADTLSLAITVLLMVGGIGVGIAAPELLLPHPTSRITTGGARAVRP